MSSFNRCLMQTATQLAAMLPDHLRSDAGRHMAAMAIAGAAAFTGTHANAQGVWGERIGGVMGRTVASEVLSNLPNTPVGRVVSDAGRSVAEEYGRSMGRKAAGGKEASDQGWRDRLDAASMHAILAADDRAKFGPFANSRTPGWDAANARFHVARDAFDTAYRAASYNRQDVSAWRAIDAALRSRPESQTSEALAQLAVEPLGRLNRPGGPGFHANQPKARITMNDIRASIGAPDAIIQEPGYAPR